jgi:parvulin-like peptidyl-prolyl isomerase
MSDLVTVNGQSMSAADAVRRSIVHDEDFLKNTVDILLLRQYAAKTGVTVSDDELQLAADELRYDRNLESVEKTHQWMKSRNQTPLSLQTAVEDMLRRNKVRSAISDSELAKYFAEHQSQYQTVQLYSIRVSNKDKASELLSQIQEGANFHALAMEHSEDDKTRHLGGYVGNLTRGEMIGEIEAAVFAAKPGQVIGPIKTDNGFNLFKVASVDKPTFDDVKQKVRSAVFENLLAKLRAEATISYPILEPGAVAPA